MFDVRVLSYNMRAHFLLAEIAKAMQFNGLQEGDFLEVLETLFGRRLAMTLYQLGIADLGPLGRRAWMEVLRGVNAPWEALAVKEVLMGYGLPETRQPKEVQ